MALSAKEILRRQVRQILKTMSMEDCLNQSNSVVQCLLQHPKYLRSRSISVFVHMPTEISTRAIFQHAFESNKRVFIPRYSPVSMDMMRVYSLSDLDALPITKWKIRQPSLDDTKREVADQELDLIIVPGLVFAHDGSRLGHGKGYYDQFLSSCVDSHGNKPYTIGLGFRQQIVDSQHLPMNTSDVRLDEILYPNRKSSPLSAINHL